MIVLKSSIDLNYVEWYNVFVKSLIEINRRTIALVGKYSILRNRDGFLTFSVFIICDKSMIDRNKERR